MGHEAMRGRPSRKNRNIVWGGAGEGGEKRKGREGQGGVYDDAVILT
jgi:hypothetical protein